MTSILSIGVDPGWTNLGFAAVRKTGDKITRIRSETFRPADAGKFGFIETSNSLLALIKELRDPDEPLVVSIERYVAYQGVLTKDAESIIMMAGAFGAAASSLNPVALNYLRAIDWKSRLVRILAKESGFRNPSEKLDKKFSLAASAHSLSLEKETVNDHEADATCLACLPLMYPSPVIDTETKASTARKTAVRKSTKPKKPNAD